MVCGARAACVSKLVSKYDTYRQLVGGGVRVFVLFQDTRNILVETSVYTDVSHQSIFQIFILLFFIREC